jgi:hypothetical protein
MPRAARRRRSFVLASKRRARPAAPPLTGCYSFFRALAKCTSRARDSSCAPAM